MVMTKTAQKRSYSGFIGAEGGAPLAAENTDAPTIEGTAQAGSSLTVDEGTWAGRSAPYFRYQWFADDEAVIGATSKTYVLTEDDIGKAFKVTVTGSNWKGSDEATSAATVAVVALAPSSTSIPEISGIAQVGETLTASDGVWAGIPAPTFTYQWKKDASNISGATAKTYEIVEGDIDGAITVTITATNSAGNATATSEATDTVIAAE